MKEPGKMFAGTPGQAPGHTITRIRFEIDLDGKKYAEAIFVRREKVQDLINDQGSLGELLRDMLNRPGA